MLNALYAIANPSVRLSVTRVDQSKTVEVRIMQFSPYSSPIPLVFELQVSSRNSDASPPLPKRGHQTMVGCGLARNKLFS